MYQRSAANPSNPMRTVFSLVVAPASTSPPTAVVNGTGVRSGHVCRKAWPATSDSLAASTTRLDGSYRLNVISGFIQPVVPSTGEILRSAKGTGDPPPRVPPLPPADGRDGPAPS